MFNPFFVAAKRWGNTFHTLLYTGPVIKKPFDHNIESKLNYQINTSLHYMISGTRNFIGLETNSSIENSLFDVVFRPQMRLQVTDNLMVGIVCGIPINRSNERISTFLRLIYEPDH
ncbi:MAG: HAEPLYID family protein [Candidatus Kapaibacteriota bacterium]